MAEDAVITHDQKIACLKREIALRRNVYRRRIAGKLMSQEDADHEMAVMVAILADYEGTARRLRGEA